MAHERHATKIVFGLLGYKSLSRRSELELELEPVHPPRLYNCCRSELELELELEPVHPPRLYNCCRSELELELEPVHPPRLYNCCRSELELELELVHPRPALIVVDPNSNSNSNRSTPLGSIIIVVDPNSNSNWSTPFIPWESKTMFKTVFTCSEKELSLLGWCRK